MTITRMRVEYFEFSRLLDPSHTTRWLNAELEQRVAVRTAQLQRSTAELQPSHEEL